MRSSVAHGDHGAPIHIRVQVSELLGKVFGSLAKLDQGAVGRVASSLVNAEEEVPAVSSKSNTDREPSLDRRQRLVETCPALLGHRD